MREFSRDVILAIIDEVYPYQWHVCDGPNQHRVSHALQFCPYCPGRLHRQSVTWREEFAAEKVPPITPKGTAEKASPVMLNLWHEYKRRAVSKIDWINTPYYPPREFVWTAVDCMTGELRG